MPLVADRAVPCCRVCARAGEGSFQFFALTAEQLHDPWLVGYRFIYFSLVRAVLPSMAAWPGPTFACRCLRVA